MADKKYRVEMKNISKYFHGVLALNNVNVNILPGEIHALMGENGAGKSTLIKILCGAYTQDKGEIYIDGNKMNINNPKEGIDQGISVIYQEFALVNDLTVAENIFIDHLTTIINWKDLKKKARDLLDELGFCNIDESAVVSDLSVAWQQVVEIAKALSRNSKVLILDEPTALLASSEVDQLFELLVKLKEEQNVSIIYISHRLDEIFRLCERITVLKDGNYVDTLDVQEATEEKLVSLMIGRNLEDYFPERNSIIGKPILEVRNINNGRMVDDISFVAREGEVLGFGGLVGSGRTETMRSIIGADKKESGKIFLNNKELKINSPQDAFKHNIAFLPEDRKTQGVLLDLAIRYNMSISCLDKYTKVFGLLNQKSEKEDVENLSQKLNIKSRSIESEVKNLSGGNQQKVAMSKLLASDSNIFIFDEPTRGVDVGAKREIYALINKLASDGNVIIVVSSEMTELIGMCDRVIIMRNGKIVGALNKEELTEENFINYSMGVSTNECKNE